MGLAPYGIEGSDQTKSFIEKIKTKIVDIKEDGSIFLNQEYFQYTYGLKMINEKKFQNLFGIKIRKRRTKYYPRSLQYGTCNPNGNGGDCSKMVIETKRITNSKNLCLSGGVALNCVANGKIEELNLFDNIYIQPASGDAGGSLGCALAINHMYFGLARKYSNEYDLMKGSYLGPYFSKKKY